MMKVLTQRASAPLIMALLVALLAGCTAQSVRQTPPQAIKPIAISIPQALKPDVNIAIFDAGIDSLDHRTATTTPGIRRAEAHYVPQRLKDTLETTGQWGTVQVVPETGREVDVMVSGKIVESDGQTLKIEVEVVDSRGEQWYRRSYDEVISLYAYDMEIRHRQEPFQNLYNRVVNDMQEYLQRQDVNVLREIKATTELRFAARFAPQAFAEYLETDANGRYTVKRLPAENDPLLARVRSIRARDQLFVANLQQSYDEFDRNMSVPYDGWREESYRERDAERELKSQALVRTLGGALAVLGGIAAVASGNNAAEVAGTAGIIGGAIAVKSGFDKRAEARIHTEAMKELSESLNAEVQPQTIALTDRNIELKGTVEEQYAQWQSLLQQIYLLESGQANPTGTIIDDRGNMTQ